MVPGSNVALLRRQLGLSQRSLSTASGVDLSTLSRLETGRGGYSAETIEKLCKVLNVSKGVLFAEPGVVEAAALGMREVPVLTDAQLATWNKRKQENFDDKQQFLHVSLRRVSGHAFALVIGDSANAPILLPGDEAIFDAGRTPIHGGMVAAQDATGFVTIGRLRTESMEPGRVPAFQVVPNDHFFPAASTASSPGLQLRGVLAECRRAYS